MLRTCSFPSSNGQTKDDLSETVGTMGPANESKRTEKQESRRGMLKGGGDMAEQ